MQAMAPQVGPLLTALPASFQARHQSCYLYAASEIVKVFGGDPQYDDALGAPQLLCSHVQRRVQWV